MFTVWANRMVAKLLPYNTIVSIYNTKRVYAFYKNAASAQLGTRQFIYQNKAQ